MSWSERQISRRRFLKGSAAAGVAGAAALAVGCENLLNMDSAYEQKEGAQPEIKITRVWGDHQPLVRSDASLSDDDEIGYTKPGVAVVALKGSGTGYANGAGLSGVWYKVREVPLYDKMGTEYFAVTDENGEQVVAADAIMAASFLRDPSQEELEKILEFTEQLKR